MGINISVTEQQINQGDTSAVRKELENLIQTSSFIKKFENDISVNLPETTPLDMIRKLKTEKYRQWFKKLDRDFPGVPYFLNQKSNTLLYFLMGNIPFDEKGNSIYFDEISAQRFFKEKVAQIKNICLPNNINPQSGINRLSALLSGEKENIPASSQDKSMKEEVRMKKGVAIKDLLDKYGSIAFLNKDRALKLTIVVEKIPEKISFLKNCLIKDSRNPQPCFLTVLKTDSFISKIRSIIFPNIYDVEEAIGRFGGVFIQVVTKAEDQSYQSLFESENVFPVETIFDSEIIGDKISGVVEPPGQSDTETPTDEKEDFSKEEEIEHDDSDEVSMLRAENAKLLKKVEQLQKLIEDYEEEIHKKQSIFGFFRKFFN